MSPQENRALVHRFYKGLNTGDQAILDETVSPDFIDHTPGSSSPTHRPGGESVKHLLSLFSAAFPSGHWTIEDLISEGDKVVVRDTFQGTHQGVLGPMSPTGKQVTVRSIHVLQIKNGKISENWDVTEDVMG